jgi:cation transport ATPase
LSTHGYTSVIDGTAAILSSGQTSHFTLIVRDELATIPKVIALSRHGRRVVVANLAIAATFITVLVLWDLLGHLPLPLGVAGHEGSTVIVGLNGMRLLSRRAWT